MWAVFPSGVAARGVAALLFSVVFGMLAACGGGGAGGSDAGAGGDGRGGEASGWDLGPAPVDADGGRSADAEAASPPPPECIADSDCPTPGDVCDCFQRCVPGGAGLTCEADRNCGSDHYCDPCLRRCFPQQKLCEPCRSENAWDPATGRVTPVGNQCDLDGSRCLDYEAGGSFCGLACLSDFGCPVGFTCRTVTGLDMNQCVPLTGDCASPYQCAEDGDCAYGEICNPVLRQCAPGCTEDQNCPDGQICSGFRCGAPCHDIENPCQTGQICDDDGRCKIPGGCIDWRDCEDLETYCNPLTSLCEAGCLESRDCKRSGYDCNGVGGPGAPGRCEPHGCEHNWYCPHSQVCDKTTGECKVPEGPYCATCDPNQEGACGPEENLCVSLQDEDGNDLGSFCFVACSADDYPGDRCPQGYQCMPVEDENGQVTNEVCFRACHVDPV